MTFTEKRNAKIAKAAEKEFDLNGYEIRNIYAVAKRRNGGKLVELESWFTDGVIDQFGFQKVECHMYDALSGERLDDVIMNVYHGDRRRSFISKTISEIK
jgi:hypothetical protein